MELVDRVNLEARTDKRKYVTDNHHKVNDQPSKNTPNEETRPEAGPDSRPDCQAEENPPKTTNPNQNIKDLEERNTTPNQPKEPTKEGFDIPTTQEAYERMVERLASVGLARWEVDKAIEAKTTAFNRACREFKKTNEGKKTHTDPKNTRVTRKNSFKNQN